MKDTHEDTVTLYHFTNHEAWGDIVYDGEIRPSDKSLDRSGDKFWPAHNAPDIVWLTTDPLPGWCCERGIDGEEPYAIRFTVRLPAHEVQDLWTWATRYKVYPDHLDPSTLHPQGEGRYFRCIERPVLAHTEWVAIDQMHRDGICAHAALYETAQARTWYAERVASRPKMTPHEVEQRLLALYGLVEALREVVREQ